ncbi:uncharacterized protein LOC143294027 [Babylonia areolata]|uniref:uncharacterized protein LOC143294027 n=1 Tax=Babylonia areolata TaxID=304850 RepID=UPI003FD0D7AC
MKMLTEDAAQGGGGGGREGEGVNATLAVAGALSDLTTSMVTELVSLSHAHNLSRVWKAEEVQSLAERARVVLSQPVALLSLALCTLSLLANLLSVTATLLGPAGRLTTHLKLVVSLGASDALLSLSTLSHLLNRVFNAAPNLRAPPEDRLAFACVSTFHFALNTMAIVISLLNLLAMALDHYVAIMNPLHYPTRLSRANGTLLICLIWTVAFLGGCSVFVADVSQFRKVSAHLNYCEYVQYSDYQGEYLVFAVAFITFFVITYTYARIYVEVRRTYRNGATNRLDFARNRKALLTTLLIIGTFVFCWLPTCLFQIALLIQVHVDRTTVHRMYATFLRANRYLNALLLLNSFADPIIYAFRLRDVQLGYRRLSHKCGLTARCCCCCCCRRGDSQQKRIDSLRSSMLLPRQQTQSLPLQALGPGGGGGSGGRRGSRQPHSPPHRKGSNPNPNPVRAPLFKKTSLDVGLLSQNDQRRGTEEEEEVVVVDQKFVTHAVLANGTCNGDLGSSCRHERQHPPSPPSCRVCHVGGNGLGSGSAHAASQV